MLRWAKANRIQPRSLTDDEPIGAWNRIKRYLIVQWTAQIELSAADAELGLLEGRPDEAIAEPLGGTVETVAGATGVEVPLRPVFGNVDEDGDPVPETTFEGRISGVMVEERRDTGELFMEERTNQAKDLTLKVPDIEKGGKGNESGSGCG